MQHQNLSGIAENSFQIGGKAGYKWAVDTDGLKLVNAAGTTFVMVTAAGADGTDVAHLSSWLNTMSTVARIDFGFDGASPPAAGTNTGKFGLCHTTGGTYLAGEIVYDDGTALLVQPIGRHIIVPSVNITGTVTLGADKAYYNKTNTAPYTWTLCGDGSGTGTVKHITETAALAASTSSTESCLDGARLSSCYAVIGTAYDNSAVITISLGSLTIGTISAADAATTGRFDFAPDSVAIATGGTLTIAISPTPTVGSVTVDAFYSDTQLS